MPRAVRPTVGSIAPVPRALAHPFIGSVQPHGVLLVVAEPHGQIVQASANTATHLGVAPEALIGRGLEQLGAEIAHAVRQWIETDSLEMAHPRRVRFNVADVPWSATLTAHRPGSGRVLVELEEFRAGGARRPMPALTPRLSAIIARLSSAHSIPAVADILVDEVRDLVGFDRVVVHRFDGEGHAEVIAESRRRGVESHLHWRYPAVESPALTQEKHLRQRMHHLADATQAAVPLVPPLNADAEHGVGLASSILCGLSESARVRIADEGVAALVEASLVHEGRLWGLLTCTHATARHLPFDLRAGCELLAEVTSTRISALEHYAEAQAEVLVRRLEHRLVEATASDGDWRRALFETPRQLLQPLGATSAALYFDGEIHTTGDAPPTADLRALFQYLDGHAVEPVFSTTSLGKLDAALARMSRHASGVLAVRLGSSRGEYLAWFRPEQPHDVTWGGHGPGAAAARTRSTPDAWREAVRQTALPWKTRERAIAKAIGASLSDIIVQLRAVRVLLAESQLATMRAAVTASADPLIIADGEGDILLVNPALAHLMHGPHRSLDTLDDLAVRFDEPERVTSMLHQVLAERRPWRGELRLAARGGEPGVPVALRADPIPSFDGGLFGVVVMLTDLTERHAAEAARERLQRTILAAQRTAGATPPAPPTVEALVAAIWANASVAVSEIGDSADPATIAPLLQEVEAATAHAVRLSALLGRFSVESGRGSPPD